jgi:ABC-2 type transport system permease protein
MGRRSSSSAIGRLFTPVDTTIAAVYTAQLGRARTGGGAVVVIATVQSLAFLVLLRGLGGTAAEPARASVVSAATLSVVAFIVWNLLAQRLAEIKSGGGLEYYGALPVRPVAVVLGFCARYGTFATPGVLATAAAGVVMFSLPITHLWVLLPAVSPPGWPSPGSARCAGWRWPVPRPPRLRASLASPWSSSSG